MPQPQPGTLQYTVIKRTSVSIRHDQVEVIITDGTTAKLATRRMVKNTNLDNIPHGQLLLLWEDGEPVPMKRYRMALQRRDNTVMSDTVDALLRVLASSATPSVDAVFNSARDVLLDADKLDDWSKLNTLLQDMDETQLRRFLAFIILILLNQSARE